MSNRIIAVLAAGLLLFCAACGDKKAELAPPVQGSTEKELFDQGEALLKKDLEKARLYLHQVIDSFPKSTYAQRAKLAIADSYFDEGDEANQILAAAEYREFIQLFPYSPSASYAQYRIALSAFDKARKPGRDQQKTQLSLNEFKRVLTIYPLSEEAKAAREKIKECEERLAEHVYLIGYQYYRMEAYRAAIGRLTEILTQYPAYSGMDQVYYYLGLSHLEGGKPDQALPFLTKLVTDYPNSKLAAKAQPRLKEAQAAMNAQPKKK